jgi:uncharacterized membrane-anchored protein
MDNKVSNEYTKLIVVLAVLFFILGGFIFYVSIPLIDGETVILATQPADPFDPIRGQYIIIRYEISTVPELPNAEVGDTIYVALEEDDLGVSRYDYASFKKPKDDVFIKGKVKSFRGGDMTLEYGIEQYFFERGARFPTRDITVEVKLSNFGGARITEILEDGKPVKIDYRNKTLTS